MLRKIYYLLGLFLLFHLTPLSNYAQYPERSKLAPVINNDGNLIVEYVNYGAYNYIGCTVWDNDGNLYDLTPKKVTVTVSNNHPKRIISKKLIFRTSSYRNTVRIMVSYWKTLVKEPRHPLGYVLKGKGYCRELILTNGEWRPKKCSF